MIVYLANQTQFRANILSHRIGEIVHESTKTELGNSVGAGELASWRNSLRHMDTVLEDGNAARRFPRYRQESFRSSRYRTQ